MQSIQLSFPGINNRKLTSVVLTFLVWTAVAAILTTKSNVYYTLRGIPTSWLHLSIHHLAAAWVWVLMTPGVYWFYKKCLVGPGKLWKRILLLIGVFPLIGAMHQISALLLDISFRKYMGYIQNTVWENLRAMDSLLVSGIFDSALITLLIVGFFFGIDAYQKRKHQTKNSDSDRLVVKQNGQFIFIDPAMIIAISAEGNYVKLHLSVGNPVLVRETMTKFLEKLNQDQFLRINRSIIANVNYVETLQHKFNGEYALTLSDGTEAVTSKRFGDSWRRLLNQ